MFIAAGPDLRCRAPSDHLQRSSAAPACPQNLGPVAVVRPGFVQPWYWSGCCLDQVHKRPGEAVAVVGPEAGGQGSGFLGGDRPGERGQSALTPIDLFLTRLPVGKRSVEDEGAHFRSHEPIIVAVRSRGRGAWRHQPPAHT